MANIEDLYLPYPDFKLQEIIDPEQFDINNEYTVVKMNEVLGILNQLINSSTAGISGADLVSLTPIAGFVSTKLQVFLEEVIATLQSSLGSGRIGTPALAGLPGTTVKDQLVSIQQQLVDHLHDANYAQLNEFMAHKDSADHDERYYPKTDTYARGEFALQRFSPTVETFVATEGQRGFTLEHGSYTIGKNRMDVTVGGVEQTVGIDVEDAVFEFSTTRIMLSEGVPAGTIVICKYYAGDIPIQMGVGHGGTHEAGAYDEIDVTTLKNYDVIDSRFIATNQQLADVENNISITPDDFEGTDIEKIQQAYAYCSENNIHNIKLNRSYDLTGGSVFIPAINWSPSVNFHGGQLLKTDSGFMFDRTINNPSINSPRFYGVDFLGGEGALTVISNGDRMIRQVFNDCVFEFIAGVHSTQYTQSLRVDGSEMYFATSSFIKSPANLDIALTNNKFETSHNHLLEAISDAPSGHSLTVARLENNVIEGYTTKPPIILSSAVGLKIDGNYFEANNIDIEFVTTAGVNVVSGVIINNGFWGSKTDSHLKLGGTNNLSRLRVENNVTNISLSGTTYFMNRVPGHFDNNYRIGGSNLFPVGVVANTTEEKINLKVSKSWGINAVAVLQNGWTGTLNYVKSELDIVSVDFNITAGTVTDNTLITTLPVGFNPLQSTPVTVRSTGGSILPLSLFFHSDGRVMVTQGNTLVTATTYTGTLLFKR